MTAALVVIAFVGVLGLVIGSFLNVVAYRVPAGVSLLRESRCPQCGAPVKPWQNVPVLSWVLLRGRCASCHAAISPRYPIVESATGVAFAAVAWWALAGGATHGPASGWAVAVAMTAFLYLAAISIVLTLIDLDTRRLPNAIVLPSYPVAVVLLTIVAAITGDWPALIRAGIGMIILYGLYAVLRAIRPGGMGGGDVKLAGILGLYLAWLSWSALVVGGFAAFVLGGIFGIILIVTRRGNRKSAIPFGPWMLLGTWVGVFAGDPIGNWYVALYSGS